MILVQYDRFFLKAAKKLPSKIQQQLTDNTTKKHAIDVVCFLFLSSWERVGYKPSKDTKILGDTRGA